MSSVTIGKTAVPNELDTRVLARILEEGYGPGAWHGADLKAALSGVSSELAFWRPSAARHNIAEIALHHAYYVRDVRARLTGRDPEPFIVEGSDWFELPGTSPVSWDAVREAVETEQRLLVDAVNALNASERSSPLTRAERFDVVLGITCHAIYHAGQVQLLKRLAEEQG